MNLESGPRFAKVCLPYKCKTKEKQQKSIILTSIWGAQHPFAGQNIQKKYIRHKFYKARNHPNLVTSFLNGPFICVLTLSQSLQLLQLLFLLLPSGSHIILKLQQCTVGGLNVLFDSLTTWNGWYVGLAACVGGHHLRGSARTISFQVLLHTSFCCFYVNVNTVGAQILTMFGF